MALSLGRNTPRGTVGLDIDGAFLAALQTSNGQVAMAASTELAPGIVSEGEVKDGEALTAALKDFFKAHALPRNVRLGISNQQIVVRHLEMPRIEDPGERDAAIRFQAAEAIAMPLDEAVLDYQLISENVSAEGQPRDRVVVVAAREAMVMRLVESVRAAGLKPEGIDLSAFALVRTLATPGPDDAPARVYCHLGGVINLAVASGTSCLFTRPLSTDLDDDAENTASSLAEEIRLSIDFYTAQPDAPPVADVLLSRREGLAEELSALIGVPVTVAEPLGSLSVLDLPPDEDPTRHTVAAGLALGALA